MNTKRKKSIGSIIFDAGNTIFLIGLSVITLYPIIHVIMASFSGSNEILSHTGLFLWPEAFNLKGYEAVFKNDQLLTGYANTLFLVIVGTTINLILTAAGAYALSRKTLYYRKQILMFFIFTMYFSGGLIPLFLTVRGLGVDGTLWAVLLPGLISTTNMLIMKTYFADLPDSLMESARIDGANEIVILFKIVLPLSMSIIAVMTMYYGVGHWNSWFYSMVFIRSERSLYPLQLILREILMLDETAGMVVGDMDAISDVSQTLKYATIIVSTVPILCIYPFLQKHFTKGVMLGAVKG